MMPGLLVAPTEPPVLRQLGLTTPVVETWGADYGWSAHGQRVGIQRKAFDDLLASLTDGRLQKELVQLQVCPIRWLVVEGRPHWTGDGWLADGRRWQRKNIRALLWSLQVRWQIGVDWTDDVTDTGVWLAQFQQWTRKPDQGMAGSTLARRPPPIGVWGSATHAEWGQWLLQSFPGIGPKVAQAIWQQFGGLPLQWTVDAKALQQVVGVGPHRAQTLWQALQPGEKPL